MTLSDTMSKLGKSIINLMNTRADRDLSNLTSTGESKLVSASGGLTQNQITNCLLEVPQRIKYTLADGTLTIKAGSVCIVPYGTEDKTNELPVGATFINENFKVYDTQYTEDTDGNGKFFVWAELVNDISDTEATTDSLLRLCEINITNATIEHKVKTDSGTSEASFTGIYYQTTDNRIANYAAGVVTDEYMSLPIAQVLSNGSYISGYLNQVFNGMGYIGSTLWVDKGIKGLCPNGRNEVDGSLINEVITTDKLYTYAYNTSTRITTKILGYELADGTDIIPQNHIVFDAKYSIYEQASTPIDTLYKWVDTVSNQIFFMYASDTREELRTPYKVKNLFLAEVHLSEGVITDFYPKSPLNLANTVNKTGDTMHGMLTFENYAESGANKTWGITFKKNDKTSYSGIQFKNFGCDATQKTPSIQENYMLLTSFDKNNNVTGEFLTKHQSNGQVLSLLRARNYSTGSEVQSEVSARVDNTGAAWAVAPASAVAGSICTTAAIKKAGNGYVKFGNGIIVQWGAFTATSKTNTAITLPIAFSSTNYRVSFQQYGTAITNEYMHAITVVSLATSKFTYCSYLKEKPGYYWIAVGY